MTDPDLIKPIFKAEEERIDKGRLVKKMSAIIGDNSLTMSGPEHRERRAAKASAEQVLKDVNALEQTRDRTPAEPHSFEERVLKR